MILFLCSALFRSSRSMRGELHMRRNSMKSFLILNFATLLTAIGVYFFKYPNHFSTGGVSGITVVLGYYLPNLSLGAINWIINLALLALGLLCIGKEFGLTTAYVTVALSAMLDLFEGVFPLHQPLTEQPFLELIFGVLLPAIGSALLFHENASTGGTDIIAMILKKYSSINIGSALFLADALIACSTFLAFGAQTGLFSILGLGIKSIIVNYVMENMNLNKSFTIITDEADEIIRFIKIDLHRGATILSAQGMFNRTDKTVIMTAVSRAQGIRLQKHIKEVSPHAFVLITNTSEVIGKGFHGGI